MIESTPALRQAFDEFLAGVQKDGTYMRLVKKYYRAAPRYPRAQVLSVTERAFVDSGLAGVGARVI